MKFLISVCTFLTGFLLSYPAFSSALCRSLFIDNLDFKYHEEYIIEEDSGRSTRRFNVYMANFELPKASHAQLISSTQNTTVEIKLKNVVEPETLLYISNKNINKNFSRNPEVKENEFDTVIRLIEKSNGIVLKMKPNQTVEVGFFIKRTRNIRDSSGSRPEEKIDWVETQMVTVRSNNDGYIFLPWKTKDFPSWLVHDWYQYDLYSMGLKIKNSQKESNLNLTLEGPILVDHSLSRSTSSAVIFDIFESAGPEFFRHQGKFSEKFISKILTNLYLPQNIFYAKKVLEKGVGEVQKEINLLGLDLYYLNNKIIPTEFFELVKKGYVPIEQGEFKKYHGEYSHALQVLAITRGLSFAEKQQFKEFYKALNVAEGGWVVWNLLFDSESPNEPINPKFWVD